MIGLITLLGRALDYVERALFVVAVASLMAIAAIMITSIAVRQFGSSIPDDIIIVQQLMLVSIACALGYATGRRAHIAVDLLYTRFGKGGRLVADMTATIAGLIAIVPVAIWAYGDFTSFFQSGRFYYGQLQMPEWPARFFFAIGLALVAVRLVQHAASDLIGLERDGENSAGHG